MSIIAVLRYNGVEINGYMPSGNVFYGIKTYWGYLHILLYTILGYYTGIDYAPEAFVMSNLFELTEYGINKYLFPIHVGIGLDTMVDMSGYLLGTYIRKRVDNRRLKK